VKLKLSGHVHHQCYRLRELYQPWKLLQIRGSITDSLPISRSQNQYHFTLSLTDQRRKVGFDTKHVHHASNFIPRLHVQFKHDKTII